MTIKRSSVFTLLGDVFIGDFAILRLIALRALRSAGSCDKCGLAQARVNSDSAQASCVLEQLRGVEE